MNQRAPRGTLGTCRTCGGSFLRTVRNLRYCESCRLCAADGCEREIYKRGYCSTHFHRLRRHGELGPSHRTRAPNAGSSINVKGYRVIVVNKRQIVEHRYVMQEMLGRPLRPGENVHHLDGDRLNNDPPNLELWVKTQPCGQRVKDRVKAALKLLKDYPELVTEEGHRLLALESQEATDYLAAIEIHSADEYDRHMRSH